MKYEAIVFDIDGTITTHISSWRFIHEKLGMWDALACRYQEQFQSGRISYRRFCLLDAAHWKGIPENEIRELFRQVNYARSAPECLRHLKNLGFTLAAISTGLQYLPERLVEEFSFDHVISNSLRARDGLLTGGVDIRITHGGKARALEKLLEETGLRPEKIIAVGDSEGDIPLANACGYSIAFNSTSPTLSSIADRDCRSGDFREVLQAILEAADNNRADSMPREEQP